MEALEKGLDPSLVLDDSVVEIPQGSTVAQFAELVEVSPNDVVKRLFMLGQALTLTQSMSDELIELLLMTLVASPRSIPRRRICCCLSRLRRGSQASSTSCYGNGSC